MHAGVVKCSSLARGGEGMYVCSEPCDVSYVVCLSSDIISTRVSVSLGSVSVAFSSFSVVHEKRMGFPVTCSVDLSPIGIVLYRPYVSRDKEDFL